MRWETGKTSTDGASRRAIPYRMARCEDRADFERWVTDPEHITCPGYSRVSEDESTPEWHGTANMAEALDLFAMGWSEAVEDVQAIGNRYAANMADRYDLTTVKRWTNTGGTLVVPAHLNGSPTPFRRRRSEEDLTPRRLIRIASAAIWWAGTTQEQLLERAAAVAALVAVVESAGCSTELWNVTPGGSDDRVVGFVVPLKGASDPMHLATAVFAMAHSSMLRRLGFAAMERQNKADIDKFGFKSGGGYGKVPDRKVVQDVTNALIPGLDVLIPTPDAVNDWQAWLDRTLKDLGFTPL